MTRPLTNRLKTALGFATIVSILSATLTATPAQAAGNPACVTSNSSSGLTYTREFTLGNNPTTCDWTVPGGVSSVELLVVGAGGAGGGYQSSNPLRAGGGGGGGEVLYKQSLALQSGTIIPVTVGSGPWNQTNSSARGLSGGDTTFDLASNPAVAKGGSGGGSGSQFDSDGGASLPSGSTGGGGRFLFSPYTETQTNASNFYTSYKYRGGSGDGVANTSNWNGESQSFGAGGGGGGAGGVGTNGRYTVYGNARFIAVYSGAGGPGKTLMGRCLAAGGSGRAAAVTSNWNYEVNRSSSTYSTHTGSWTIQPNNAVPQGCAGTGLNAGADAGYGGSSSQYPTKAGNGLVVVRFQIDSPVISSPQSSGLVKPVISGTSVAGSKVTVTAGGATFSNIAVNSSGNWSLDTATVRPTAGTFALLVGDNTITAKTTISASPTMESATSSFILNLNPTTPVAATHLNLLAESNTADATDYITSDNTPRIGVSFSDTFEEGSTFTIRATKSGVTKTCTSDRSALNYCDLPSLADGTWLLSAYQTNLVGTNSATTTSGFVTVDTVAPSAPTSFAMSTDTGLISNDRVTSGLTQTFRALNVLSSETLNISSSNGSESGPSCTAIGNPRACSLTFPSDGVWQVSATLTDIAGNISNPSTLTITLDNQVEIPTISNTAPQLNSTSVAVAFAGESGTTFKCQLDTGAVSTCTSPRQLSALNQGAHTFKVYQIDLAGNTSGVSSYEFSVDTIAPQVSITELPAGTQYGSNITISFAAEVGTTLLCQLDSQLATACTANNRMIYTDLSSGNHSFRLTATDAFGNSTSRNIIWAQNSAGISTPSIQTQNGWSNEVMRSIYFIVDPGASSTQCSLDGAEFITCSSPFTSGLLNDGEHTFRVRSLGADFYVSGIDTYTWVQDTVVPEAPIVPQSGVLLNASPLTINFTAPSGSLLTCKLDTALAGPCTSATSMVFQNLSQGDHQLVVTNRDLAGNSSSSTFSWSHDSWAPAQPIASNWSLSSTTVGRTIIFTVASDVVTAKCSLDDAEFQTCSSPYVTGSLADGEHTFRIQGFDAHGNGSAIRNLYWRQLIAAPTAPAFTGNTYLITSSPRIYFSVAAGTTATCSLDGGAPTPCGSNGFVDYWGLSEGSHSLEVTATNIVGATASNTYSWTQDTLIPSAPAIQNSSPYARTSTVVVTFSQDIDVRSTTCSLDGGAYVTCTSPHGLSNLSDGSHSIRVKSVDYANHMSPVGTYSWIQDTVAPTSPVISNQAAISSSNTLSFQFTSNAAQHLCSLDLGSWENCTTGESLTVGSDGQHSILVKARDEAGNESAPTRYDWTVDTIAPALPGPKPGFANPSGITSTRSATIYFRSGSNDLFECQHLLDSVVIEEWETCESGVELSNLDDGSHDFEVRSFDAAGNKSESMHTTWRVLHSTPSTPIQDPEHPMVNSSTSQFAWFYVYFQLQPALTAECRILRNETEIQGWTACETGDQINTPEGNYDLYIRSVNEVNNVSPSLHYEWTVDYLDVEDPNSGNRPTISSDGGLITLTGANATNGFRYQYRAVSADSEVLIPWTLTTNSFSLRLANGRYLIEARMVNQANGVGQVASAFVTIDEQQPAPRVGSVPNVHIDTSAVAGYTRQVSFPVTIDWPVGTAYIRLSSTDNPSSSNSRNVLQLMTESVSQPGSRVVNWSFTPDGVLPASTKLHLLTANFLDASGEVISSAQDSVIIDSSAPTFGRIQVTNYVGNTLYVRASANDESLGSGITNAFVARGQTLIPSTFAVAEREFVIPNVAVGDTLLLAVSDRVGNISTPLSLNVLNFEPNNSSTVVSGVALVGKTLTLKTTGFSASRKVSYQWFADGTAIAGATKTTLKLTSELAGKAITATSTGIRAGYFPIYSDSQATTRVEGGMLSPGALSISGSATVGGTLTAVPGVWALSPDFLYEWKIGNLVVSTLPTFSPSNDHAGMSATLKVTAVKTGFTALSKTVTSSLITGGTLVLGTAEVSDTFVGVDRTLTAVTNAWEPADVSFGYQWLRNGVLIPKATGKTYKLTAADFGQSLSVRVTGNKPGFNSGQVSSSASSIQLGTIVAPLVTTTNKVTGGKRVFTAVAGSWTPAPVALSYQWLRNGVPITKATAKTYTAVAADKGRELSVRITGTRFGFNAVTATSATTQIP